MRIISTVEDERIDRFLVQYFKSQLSQPIARHQIQKAISQKVVLVNDKLKSKHYALQLGDVITLPDDYFAPQPEFRIQPNFDSKIDIIAETTDYLICNKPAGVIMHPSENHLLNDTFINVVLAYDSAIATVGDDIKFRPGIIQRLDKDVSGVVMITRNQASYEYYKALFSERQIHKQYIALVHGVLSQPSGDITFQLARSTQDRTKMAARPVGSTGKPAHTHYEVVEQFQQYALLDITIYTGRTHQIRVHMSAVGHPIVGDELYMPRGFKSRLHPGRLFLQSTELGFVDQQGEKQLYSLPLSQDLKAIIHTLS